MADRFAREIDLPDVGSAVSVPLPPAGAISVYGRNGKLAALNAAGSEVLLEPQVVSSLIIDGGNAATVPAQVALRIDFGLGA